MADGGRLESMSARLTGALLVAITIATSRELLATMTAIVVRAIPTGHEFGRMSASAAVQGGTEQSLNNSLPNTPHQRGVVVTVGSSAAAA